MVVDTLAERFPDASATFLWMDVLCVSQAPTLSGNNPDWFRDGLVDLIASKRGAFAVFDSWKRSKLFDRSWCVWGMLAASVKKKLLAMLLRSAEGTALLETIRADSRIICSSTVRVRTGIQLIFSLTTTIIIIRKVYFIVERVE